MLEQVFGSEEALDQMATVHPIARIGRPEEMPMRLHAPTTLHTFSSAAGQSLRSARLVEE